MAKVKKVAVVALKAAFKPELRPFEVKAGRYLWAVVAAYLGYKGVKAA